MYNDQKTKNEGQTICTMIRRQRTNEDQTKNNMYNDQKTKNEGQYNMYNDQKTKNEGQTICTMIRRQGNDQKTKDRQYVQ